MLGESLRVQVSFALCSPRASFGRCQSGCCKRPFHHREALGIEVLQPVVAGLSHACRFEQHIIQPRLKAVGFLIRRWPPPPS